MHFSWVKHPLGKCCWHAVLLVVLVLCVCFFCFFLKNVHITIKKESVQGLSPIAGFFPVLFKATEPSYSEPI